LTARRKPAGPALAPKLLSTKEAAERLGVATNTILRMVRDGELRVVNLGRKGERPPRARIRIREDDLAAVIDARTYRAPRRGRTHLGAAS
jgi:excisionase family DNA binding protein